MKFWIPLVLISTIFAQPAFAQRRAGSNRSALYRYLAKDFKQVQFGYTFWQEMIDGKSPAGEGELMTHFEGLHFQGNLVRPRRNLRWVHTYGAAFSFGMARGSFFGSFNDYVGNQPWLAASAHAGLVYRASLRTELEVSVPLTFRYTIWQLKSSSDIELERESTFSYGVAGALIGRLTRTSALHFKVTHQHAWNSTQWTFGYQKDIR